MSNYICSCNKHITDAELNLDLELNPSDYLWCASKLEMLDAVEEDLVEAADSGDIDIYDYDINFDIPNKFIEEWKSLKGLK